ncbi:unnamed protein product [Closterium sp. NIES-64]|nr:unnamed protein product [Closterium sp. NIES-64]
MGPLLALCTQLVMAPLLAPSTQLLAREFCSNCAIDSATVRLCSASAPRSSRLIARRSACRVAPSRQRGERGGRAWQRTASNDRQRRCQRQRQPLLPASSLAAVACTIANHAPRPHPVRESCPHPTRPPVDFAAAVKGVAEVAGVAREAAPFTCSRQTARTLPPTRTSPPVSGPLARSGGHCGWEREGKGLAVECCGGDRKRGKGVAAEHQQHPPAPGTSASRQHQAPAPAERPRQQLLRQQRPRQQLLRQQRPRQQLLRQQRDPASSYATSRDTPPAATPPAETPPAPTPPAETPPTATPPAETPPAATPPAEAPPAATPPAERPRQQRDPASSYTASRETPPAAPPVTNNPTCDQQAHL